MPCQLLDGFSLSVQAFLGLGSFTSLLYKRARERPQRKLRIWLFDTSKQALSAGLIHVMNMALAEVVGDEQAAPPSSPAPPVASGGAPRGRLPPADEGSDPCVIYVVNLMFDVAVGTAVSYSLLRACERGLVCAAESCCCPHTLRNCANTGYYGSPPALGRWAHQLFLWVSVVFASKVLCALVTLRAAPLMAAGRVLLAPLKPFPHVELVVVMLAAPLLLNIAQLWIQDNFLKLGRRQVRADAYAPLYRCPVVEMHGPPGAADMLGRPECDGRAAAAATLQAVRLHSADGSAAQLAQPPTAWGEIAISRDWVSASTDADALPSLTHGACARSPRLGGGGLGAGGDEEAGAGAHDEAEGAEPAQSAGAHHKHAPLVRGSAAVVPGADEAGRAGGTRIGSAAAGDGYGVIDAEAAGADAEAASTDAEAAEAAEADEPDDADDAGEDDAPSQAGRGGGEP